MSKEQRAQVDAMLRQPRPEAPQSVEALRAGLGLGWSTNRHAVVWLPPRGLSATFLAGALRGNGGRLPLWQRRRG